VQRIIAQGEKLLPAGIIHVEGKFDAGAAVRISDANGRVIARGLTNYGSDSIDAIKGKKTAEISVVLGRKDFDEVVHRDNMAFF
jgi:glutamate 5-kinase